MASAVLTGSSTSGGGGLRAVLTEQKRQPRVQVSPSNCIEEGMEQVLEQEVQKYVFL